ncbi:hypothetical protein PoB_003070500 [Plakobranchus ocellatus]|uniref:Uncharacterized protein n=1 Tax=Plakobranchus ocellatus TaxID=259542 RepID=A0AAV4ABJ8_9GAST|nr:hypothetical protein PoB_003070500 [Plakobranchus ocellatus]
MTRTNRIPFSSENSSIVFVIRFISGQLVVSSRADSPDDDVEALDQDFAPTSAAPLHCPLERQHLLRLSPCGQTAVLAEWIH